MGAPQPLWVVARWSAAMGVCLAVFAVCWWAWETLQLPPAGSDRLGVSLAVAAAVSAASSGPLFWWAGRGKPGGHRGGGASLVRQVPPTAGWVDRSELADVVSALTTADSGAVALTTGLVGAGGFGKTMLAARACQHRAVQRRFRGGIVWVTVGKDLRGAELAVRISEVITNLGGATPVFTSAEQAGYALARALAARGRTLLVADDVWSAGQVEPFAAAVQAGRLLVTTQRPAVLAPIGRTNQD